MRPDERSTLTYHYLFAVPSITGAFVVHNLLAGKVRTVVSLLHDGVTVIEVSGAMLPSRLQVKVESIAVAVAVTRHGFFITAVVSDF